MATKENLLLRVGPHKERVEAIKSLVSSLATIEKIKTNSGDRVFEDACQDLGRLIQDLVKNCYYDPNSKKENSY